MHHAMEIRRTEADPTGLFTLHGSCTCGGCFEILVRERWWKAVTLTDPEAVFPTAHFAGGVFMAGYPPCPAVLWSHKYEEEMIHG